MQKIEIIRLEKVENVPILAEKLSSLEQRNQKILRTEEVEKVQKSLHFFLQKLVILAENVGSFHQDEEENLVSCDFC